MNLFYLNHFLYIVNHILRDKERVLEGELRCQQLVKHLERINAPKAVFLSEDGSGIVKRVVYDSHTNQLIGLVLPLNKKNGMPELFTYQAKSREAIQQLMELPQSTHVYIVVAQPLNENGIPFILQIFSTNNQFESADVLKRWKYTKAELNKYTFLFYEPIIISNFLCTIQSCRHGIEVIGTSSDGDPRLLGAMKNQVNFDMFPDIDRIKRFNQRLICVQDPEHLGTKLRNKILNSSLLLQIGSGVASVYHIKMLLDTLPKEVHGLVLSDIYPEDRQNFKSLVKIMDSRVTEALNNHVVDSNATVMYLTLCHQVTSSFIDENLQPLERVYRIWNALYFTRCWRKWVQITNGVTLSNNFISSNAYCCIEINAHALIDLIVKLQCL